MSHHECPHASFTIFFFNDPATTDIYTLSLHDALPIWLSLFPQVKVFECMAAEPNQFQAQIVFARLKLIRLSRDRKSTRLNSSHVEISYAVFCLKKKTKQLKPPGVMDMERVTVSTRAVD